MPNPFLRLGTPSQSKEAPEHESAETPILEAVVGSNNPYRGSQDHGVMPTAKPSPTPDNTGSIPALFELEEPPPEPIPVRIVQQGTREIRRFTTQQVPVGSAPVRVLGRDANRRAATVAVADPVVVWFGGDFGVSAFSGWGLSNGGQLKIEANDEVWAVSSDANQHIVFIALEYAVRES
jgi:hypothetical protein